MELALRIYEKELESMTNTIVGMIPDAAVILFGSYSRGEQRQYSDLDICVVMPKLKKRSLDAIGVDLNDKTKIESGSNLLKINDFDDFKTEFSHRNRNGRVP
ncbi:MAG: nucleotidyltransferase domain-containing protein, partial [Peptococcaceae bacterium]|nr:nucleotidyltransferase domain-containing protein [Peptococcaceae bacterium]